MIAGRGTTGVCGMTTGDDVDGERATPTATRWGAAILYAAAAKCVRCVCAAGGHRGIFRDTCTANSKCLVSAHTYTSLPRVRKTRNDTPGPREPQSAMLEDSRQAAHTHSPHSSVPPTSIHSKASFGLSPARAATALPSRLRSKRPWSAHDTVPWATTIHRGPCSLPLISWRRGPWPRGWARRQPAAGGTSRSASQGNRRPVGEGRHCAPTSSST